MATVNRVSKQSGAAAAGGGEGVEGATALLPDIYGPHLCNNYEPHFIFTCICIDIPQCVSVCVCGSASVFAFAFHLISLRIPYA